MNIKQILFLTFGVLLCSCTSTKKLTYLNEAELDEKIAVTQQYKLKIAKDDILVVSISSETPELVAPFMQGGEKAGASASQANTFLVNSDGEIQFPVLGRIKVEGMTHKELSMQIEKLIIDGGYINDPVVNVRLQNFRIVVLGDVSSPGVKHFTSDRVSIFDVIAISGDINASGLKRNVFLVREDEGERIVTNLDVTNADIFSSPYYYLQQNDIVYVKPNDRTARGGQLVNDDRYFSLGLTFITTAASVLIGALLF